MKNVHEQRVDQSIGLAQLQSREMEEHFAARIAVWESKAQLERWQDLTSHLNEAHPLLHESEWNSLFDLSAWLLELRWPTQYAKVTAAFENHRRVLTILANHLSNAFEYSNSWYKIDRPHTRIDWDPKLYTRLLSSLGVNCHITWLLTIELTRTVNLVITAVAEEFDPLYRFDEGFVLMADGDLISGHTLSRLEYNEVDWEVIPHDYSLSAIEERMTEALKGGDPRGGHSIALSTLVLADWLAELAPPSNIAKTSNNK